MAVFRLRKSAEAIQEWQPTQPTYSIGILTILMLILLGIGWTRSGRVPLSELVTALVCLVFAWTAWRNVTPGLVLLAPLTAHRLVAAFPEAERREPRWSRPMGIALATLLTLAGLVGMVGRSHVPYSTQPIRLAQSIAQLGGGQRVLNDYNVAGIVLYFGGEGVRVGIDGRADKYGPEYIEAYLGLQNLKGDWKALLTRLDPTSALIPADTALAQVLQSDYGWQVRGREGGWVLLTAPAH